MLFFNDRYQFTDKVCADVIRFTRTNDEGNFNGFYKDITRNDILLGRGHYNHGKKDGYFEVYYPNGKPFSKGFYRDGKPVGEWTYYHENGEPERTLIIVKDEVFIMRYADHKGNIQIADGVGEFSGLVAENGTSSNSIVAMGKVENGRPEGKWKSFLTGSNIVYCREDFIKGKLISGNFPNAVAGAKREYNEHSFLSTFFLADYLTALESFPLEKCVSPEDEKKYSFSKARFKGKLNPKISIKIENDLRIRKALGYIVGDNFIAIRFKVNQDGQPENFLAEGGWGIQFFEMLCDEIRLNAKFHPNSGVMYFNLRINYRGGLRYEFEFKFSDKPQFY
jgi:hypothetical protein